MFFMRPLPGWSNHATPVEALLPVRQRHARWRGHQRCAGRNAAQMVAEGEA
jgi:hypothetical protein